MDRLSTLDAEFLHLEDGIAHMHIAGICAFDGDPPSAEELRRLVAGKLHLIPRYRQRVRAVPLELNRPVWVDEPHFELDYHLRRTALPAPGDDEQLRRLMGRLMSQPLDRQRPLWEGWLVEGLRDGGWALIFKVHHCMVDGIAGVGLLSVLLDVTPDAEVPTPEPWQPEPEPATAELVRGALADAASSAIDMARRTPGVLRSPTDTWRNVRWTARGVSRFVRSLAPTPPSSIEGTIGPHRVWAHSSASLEDVRRIRTAFGGTINDIVLTAVSGGHRRLLSHRGEDPDTTVIRSMIPVSVRRADRANEVSNRVSTLLYELPVDEADPVRRLARVSREMTDLKESGMAAAGEAISQLSDLAPPIIVGPATRIIARAMHRTPQRSINTVTTNVPGPQFPLHCLGREMRAYLPYVPISHGVRVGTAILSYNGNLGFGVTGDYDCARDVDLLADAIAEGVSELVQRAAPLVEV